MPLNAMALRNAIKILQMPVGACTIIIDNCGVIFLFYGSHMCIEHVHWLLYVYINFGCALSTVDFIHFPPHCQIILNQQCECTLLMYLCIIYIKVKILHYVSGIGYRYFVLHVGHCLAF